VASNPMQRNNNEDRQADALPAVGSVAPLTFQGDNDALVRALRNRHPGAAAALWDRYGAMVYRTVSRTLGPDPEVPDLVQETFIRAIDAVRGLNDSERLSAWLCSVAVFTTRAFIRRRARRRWLSHFGPDEVGPTHQRAVADEAREALRLFYGVMDTLPTDERIAFVLRFVDGMSLIDGAAACNTSLATFKRRLSRGEKRFLVEAELQPSLRELLDEGTRWGRGGRT